MSAELDVQVFGLFSVRTHGGDVIVTKQSIVGRSTGGQLIAWLPEQVEQALAVAHTRRTSSRNPHHIEDAACEVRALEAALAHLRKRKGQR